MRFWAGCVAISLLIVSQAWAAGPELYEALGSPAGRFLLEEVGAGSQISERWADVAAHTGAKDPTEEVLERVRLKFIEESPQDAHVFNETLYGPALLDASQRARLKTLLEEQVRMLEMGAGPDRSFVLRREAFLNPTPKERWVQASKFEPEGNDETLALVRRDALRLAARGEKATVVFDLDETGIDNRYGTAAMLLGKDGWVHSPESAAFPRARQALMGLQLRQFRVMAEDIFRIAGVADETDAMKSVEEFLGRRIHSAEKAEAYGAPYPGFVEYVKSLHDAGVRIVYITGRPAGLQTQGTRELLEFFGLPLDANAELFLKVAHVPTAAYKARTLADLMASGSRVVAIFDNEPDNLFEMARQAPDAKIVFMDSDFTQVPSASATGWYRIRRW
jgi:phosphoserine phosphatase